MQSFIDELEDEFDPATYFKCPITGKSFDIEKMIPNKRILAACRDFQKKNPWSYDFNPSEDYQKIKVWTNNNNWTYKSDGEIFQQAKTYESAQDFKSN